MTMPAGLHIVRKLRKGKPVLWYVYAWRGGPCISKSEGARPKITAALTDAAAEKRRNDQRAADDTLAGLIAAYRSPTTAEWNRLAASTKATWNTWLGRIHDRFGDTPLEALTDRRMRGDILEWRDKWAHQPRSADMAMQAFSRLLSWGVDRGKLSVNIAAGVEQLYEADRSDIIWEAGHFEAFTPHASVEVNEGVDLAACTGLRRGDLVNLPWTAVGAHAIIWKTAKSRGRNNIVIPLLPETRALFDRIKARHAAEMEARPANKRREMPATVLSNSKWRSWTASGFGSRFNDAKLASKVDVHLHDLRGTFATRCMIAGLTDQQIADILGWSTKDVSQIRMKYVDQARVVIAIGERIAAASMK